MIELSPSQVSELADAIAKRLAERMAKQSALVDYSGISEFLNCSIPHVERLKRTGQIPFVQLGRRIMFERRAVLAALSKKETGAAQ